MVVAATPQLAPVWMVVLVVAVVITHLVVVVLKETLLGEQVMETMEVLGVGEAHIMALVEVVLAAPVPLEQDQVEVL